MNRVNVGFFVGFLFLSSTVPLSSKAAGNIICDSLSEVACKPGKITDPTGDSLFDQQGRPLPLTKSLLKKSEDVTKSYFQKLWTEQGHKKFKALAFKVLEASKSPYCASSSQAAPCVQLVSTQLSEMVTSFSNVEDLKKKYKSPDLVDLYQMEEMITAAEKLDHAVAMSPLQVQLENTIKNKTFPKVKALLIKFIDQQSMSKPTKEALLKKISAIQYDGTECREMSSGLSVNFTVNAAYFDDSNSFKYCRGLYLQSTSEFQIAAIIAHELSHSIDPCLISQGISGQSFKYQTADSREQMDAQYPIKGIISCLRSSNSIQANYNKNISYYISPPRSKNENPFKSSIPFCQGDQVNEAFPDWIAAEILPEYISETYPSFDSSDWRKGIANAMRSLCNNAEPEKKSKGAKLRPTEEQDFVEHPFGNARMDAILLSNPKVREAMNCPEKGPKAYCASQSRPSSEIDSTDSKTEGQK